MAECASLPEEELAELKDAVSLIIRRAMLVAMTERDQELLARGFLAAELDEIEARQLLRQLFAPTPDSTVQS